ncbi:cytochrome P450 [Mycena sanguinolenta]|nr:cytochrome P450 [Mycena sanguinolenta]
MTSQLFVPIAATCALYAVYGLVKMIHRDYTSPLRDLPGPKGGNLIIGHFRRIMQDSTAPDKWCEEFGANYQMKSFFGTRDLYTIDTRALNHILTNDHIYQKGPVANSILIGLLGNGILSAETTVHRRQRKILNPAFGVPQIRALTEIFNCKSAQLRDIMSREIGEGSRVDVFGWLRKMTLDVIGEAGFNYQFNALDPDGRINDLDVAFTRLMHSPQSQRYHGMRLLQAEIPILSFLPTPGKKVVEEAREKMVNIAKKLLADSQADIRTGGVSGTQRDLLSLLVQSNTSDSIQEHQRLSDAEVIARTSFVPSAVRYLKSSAEIPTFFVAGHETTSAATAVALHALSIHPSVQARLRDELSSLATDEPTMDELNSLPYLEKVVRETMRLYPPVGFSMREAMENDVLPLSRPYFDRTGKTYDSITIRKGTAIRIPISAVHRDKTIWGDDAAVFRPERWDNIPEAASAIPSVWGNLMTFLAGPHNCIGFRFSLVEIKSILFTLVRAFEFEPAVPEDAIAFSPTPVRRPKVITEPDGGNQLPLIVKPYLKT